MPIASLQREGNVCCQERQWAGGERGGQLRFVVFSLRIGQKDVGHSPFVLNANLRLW
jgi:hypothetical protein